MRLAGILGALLVIVFSYCPVRSADLFRWVDDKGVVHFTDNLHNIPERYRSGTTRVKSHSSPNSESAPTPLFLERATIPFKKRGNVVVIPVLLNDQTSGNFIVDTGASYTMISKAVAKKLDINMDQKLPTLPFQTANGVIQAPLVNLSSVDAGGLRVTDVTAAVHDAFGDSDVHGLLGLNYLSQFRMDIDTQNGVLQLERK